MQRSWLVLLVLGTVVLAGCSAPGGSASADVSYPDGWGPDGPNDAARAVSSADDVVGDDDFVERWVTVEETAQGMDEPYRIVVTEVRLDRDRERLLQVRQFYLVDAALAGSVAENGTAPLADRTANEVRRVYLDASGGVQYHRLESRSPRVTQMESTDFASATDQPLPAALVGSAPVLESAAYSDPTQTDASVEYSIANVSAFHVQDGGGRLTVGSDGLVSAYSFTAVNPDSEVAFRYDIDVGDVSVDPPEWAG